MVRNTVKRNWTDRTVRLVIPRGETLAGEGPVKRGQVWSQPQSTLCNSKRRAFDIIRIGTPPPHPELIQVNPNQLTSGSECRWSIRDARGRCGMSRLLAWSPCYTWYTSSRTSPRNTWRSRCRAPSGWSSLCRWGSCRCSRRSTSRAIAESCTPSSSYLQTKNVFDEVNICDTPFAHRPWRHLHIRHIWWRTGRHSTVHSRFCPPLNQTACPQD